MRISFLTVSAVCGLKGHTASKGLSADDDAQAVDADRLLALAASWQRADPLHDALIRSRLSPNFQPTSSHTSSLPSR